jgi:hypothetical protein
VSGVADALERLPQGARSRLERFSQGLERVHVDDLPLYAVRQRQPDHRRAVETAALVAHESHLEESIDAARGALVDYISRQYAGAQLRVSYVGVNAAGGLGPTDDRVRVMRSLGDAAAAIVLWDKLDEADRAELLGQWARLLP